MSKLFQKRDVQIVPQSLWRTNSLSTLTPTGLNVTPEIAMQVTAFFAAIRFRAFSLASLPKILYQRVTGGKRRATEKLLYSLLHDMPNHEMTAFDMWSMMDAHRMVRGNSYAEIEFDQGNGEVIGFWPLRPDRMELARNESNELRYLYTLPSGEKRVFRPEQILHLRGLTTDGVMGIAPITAMRSAVGLAKATEDYGGAYFGNGANPGVVLKHPGKFKDGEVYKRLKDGWEESHRGLDNSHRVAILEEGMDISQVGLSPEDSQFLETRTFQTFEIARMTDVPPNFIFELSKSSYSTNEQLSLDYVVHHLRPYLVADEQQIFRSVLLQRERDAGYFVENLIDGLLRGDLVSRYNAYAIGKQNGWLTTNKILAMENMNTIGAKGDVYTVPLNMSVLGDDGMPLPVPAAAPAGAPNTPARSTPQTPLSPAETSPKILLRGYLEGVMPLLRDAAERIGKRELNEFTSARKKFGNNARFAAWAEQFYKQDYPAFIRTVVNPLVESGFVDDEKLTSFDGYCASRGELALTDEMGVYVVEDIVKLFEESSDE